MTAKRKCIGYTDTGKGFDCPNDAGSSHSKLWCQSCDDVRLARLKRQFAELEASFDAGARAGETTP